MSDLISRCELFNRLATIAAPPEANDFKAEIYKVIQGMETADFIETWLSDPEAEPAIVRDYNGHLRSDQINLDAVANMSELRRMIDDQRREINRLRTACDNYDEANKKIGEELTATRWELIKARKEIEKLTTVKVDYEVVRSDCGYCMGASFNDCEECHRRGTNEKETQ